MALLRKVGGSLVARHAAGWLHSTGRYSRFRYSETQDFGLLALYAAAAVASTVLLSSEPADCERLIEHRCGVQYREGEVVTNWSGTHTCSPLRVYEPNNAQEVLRLLRFLHDTGAHARPIGTALSPNGIGMADCLISLSNIDYIRVNEKERLVTVGAGARVSDVLKRLDKHGLTLANFSSIQEQQVAGWTQVAAHGTGATLPTVEEMITDLKLATPTEGLLPLGRDPITAELFAFAKAGLGSLGVVTELTFRCIPKLSLTEHTFVTTIDQLRPIHHQLLTSYRHVRYMWIPYTTDVVVVCSNPSSEPPGLAAKLAKTPPPGIAMGSTQALVDLLAKATAAVSGPSRGDTSGVDPRRLSFSQLRDSLLALRPLDVEHVRQVNMAERDFWKGQTGTRTADSTQILGFDCGGEQLVYEVCIPVYSLHASSTRDLDFVQEVLQVISSQEIPAPCPLEQRWTAASTAPMSPAYSERGDEVFSWLGIIMYLPQEADRREEVQASFARYVKLLQPVVDKYHGKVHWAKVPAKPAVEKSSAASVVHKAPSSSQSWWQYLTAWTSYGTAVGGTLSESLDKRDSGAGQVLKKYPLAKFNAYRRALDPKDVLGNALIRELFDQGSEQAAAPVARKP